MSVSQPIQPEAALLSARWIVALIACCVSSLPARFCRLSRPRLSPFIREKSGISNEKPQFLDGALTAKYPPIVEARTVRHTNSSVKTSYLNRAVDLPRLRYAVIGGHWFAPRGSTASRQGSSYDAEDDRQFSRSGRDPDFSVGQRQVNRLRY